MQTPISKDIAAATRFIQEGRVVAVPTGTSYGLAVDALQGYALQRVRNMKERPADKTFTVFMTDELFPTHLDVTESECELIRRFSNQPLTLLVKPRKSLNHLAQDGLVGLRIIDHPLMRQLAEETAVPLTATSANKADKPPCFSPECIQQSFPSEVEPTVFDLSLACILDGGTLPKSKPTTIARLKEKTLEVIRLGALSESALHI